MDNTLTCGRYRKLKLMGEGAYGAVYKCQDTQHKNHVAIKVIKLEPVEGLSSSALREVSILKTLDHPNIIPLLATHYEVSETKSEIILVFPFVNEDLSRHMKRIKQLDSWAIKSYLYDILKALRYIHSKMIFHRDLKPQNILVNDNGKLIIADFGLGRSLVRPLGTMSREIQTLWYRAPEILLGTRNYTIAVDMWSVGCIFYQLCNKGQVLFRADSEIDAIFKIFQRFGTPTKSYWPQLATLPDFRVKIKYTKPSFPKFTRKHTQVPNLDKAGNDLFQKMLELNPAKRISVQEALHHSYFDDHCKVIQ